MSSAQSSLSAYLDRERKMRSPYKEMLERYASRCPMNQLPDRYRVTAANPDPPLVHFAIPVHVFDLYKYADKHDLLEYIPRFPQVLSPVSALVATERLSQEVEYELEFSWPFEPTADCGVILSLYDNYTMEEKILIDEDQEDVIQMGGKNSDWTDPYGRNGISTWMIRATRTMRLTSTTFTKDCNSTSQESSRRYGYWAWLVG